MSSYQGFCVILRSEALKDLFDGLGLPTEPSSLPTGSD